MQELEFLTPEQIDQNYKRFRQLINEYFPSRRDKLNQMYDDLEEVLIIAPASSYEHFHNAFPGGYVDHVLRVVEFAEREFKRWKEDGLLVDNITLEEIRFVAFQHDLGKLGYKDQEFYRFNESEWHRKNQGKIYDTNSELQSTTTFDRTFILLNKYGITCNEVEYLGIKLTDGLYDESNKPYLITYDLKKKLKTNLPYIIHNADMKAARFEFERWAIKTNKISFRKIETPKNELLEKFDKIFDL